MTWLSVVELAGLMGAWVVVNLAVDRAAKCFVLWRAARCRALLRQPRCNHGRVRELCDECGGAQ